MRAAADKMKTWITIDPRNYTPRIYENEVDALRESVELNKNDPDHPSFLLFSVQRGKTIYEGRLDRQFGASEFTFSDRVNEPCPIR